MKKVSAVLLLLFSFISWAQSLNIKAVVKDAITNEPIVSASVGLKNSPIGTITNGEGVFQLTVPNAANVLISYLGYKTATIPVADFTGESKTIFLEQSEEVLEEVMVVKIPLQQVLNDVIVASKARFNKPIILHTYYREFVKINDKYKKFSDGLLDYHASGNSKKTSADLIIKQNRSFSLASATADDDDDDQISASLNVQRGISNSYSFEFVERNILKGDRSDDYDFTLKSKKDSSGQELYTIIIEPKSTVEKSLFEGKVLYDPLTKLIYDVDLHFAESHKQFPRTISLLGLHVSTLDMRFRAAYKLVNNNYVLSYNNRFVKYKQWTKSEQELTESRSDLIVTDFENDDLTYSKKDVFKKKYLYDKPTNYSSKYWQKNNAIVLTNEEEKVISSLETTTANQPAKP